MSIFPLTLCHLYYGKIERTLAFSWYNMLSARDTLAISEIALTVLIGQDWKLQVNERPRWTAASNGNCGAVI
jgi:hypothetical protein